MMDDSQPLKQELAEPTEASTQAEQTIRKVVEWSLLAALMVMLFAATSFMLLAREITGLSAFDTSGLVWAHEIQSPALDISMRTLTEAGSALGLTIQVLLLASLLAWRRPDGWRWELGIILLAIIGGALLNQLLKFNYQRLRPTLFPGPYVLESYSFPSGHAMGATCFYGAIAWVLGIQLRALWRKTLVLLVAALMVAGICLSRVYFAVHYPTDVIGGVVAGLAWLIFSVAIMRAVYRHRLRQRLPN